MSNPVAQRIERKLSDALDLLHLSVANESGNHNVPAGSESHFKLVLVGPDFAQMTRINRHRQVNEILADELAGPVHALAIHAYAPDEWARRFGDAPMSPPCMGGEAGPIADTDADPAAPPQTDVK